MKQSAHQFTKALKTFSLFMISAVSLSSCSNSNSDTSSSTVAPAVKYEPVFYSNAVITSNGNSVNNIVSWKNGVASVLPSTDGTTTYTNIWTNAGQTLVHGTDVYLYGAASTNAGQNTVYWKNGVLNTLPMTDGTTTYTNTWLNAKQAFFHGSDLYFYSSATSNQNQSAVYWKNGILNTLPMTDGTNTYTQAWLESNQHFIDGSDLYFYGTVHNGNGYSPVYWKNGVLNTLPMTDGSNTYIHAWLYGGQVFKNGSDLYFYTTAQTTNGNQLPVYWKNGILNALSMTDGTNTFNNAWVYQEQAFAVGSDIYFYGTAQTANGTQLPVYWKNGVLNVLPITDGTNTYLYSWLGSAQHFTIGSDIYFYSYAQKADGNSYPIYWKNGVLTSLPMTDGTNTYTSASLGSAQHFTIGSDIYFYSYAQKADGNSYPIYWKNGVLKSLPLTDGTNTYTNGWLAAHESFANGSDIYFCGTTQNASGYQFASCWKNDVIIPLQMTTNNSDTISNTSMWGSLFGGSYYLGPQP